MKFLIIRKLSAKRKGLGPSVTPQYTQQALKNLTQSKVDPRNFSKQLIWKIRETLTTIEDFESRIGLRIVSLKFRKPSSSLRDPRIPNYLATPPYGNSSIYVM